MKIRLGAVWQVALIAVGLQLLLRFLSVPKDVGLLSQSVLLLQRLFIGSTPRPASTAQHDIDTARWAIDFAEHMIDFPVPVASVQQIHEVYEAHDVRGVVYTPTSAASQVGGAPVLIFFHGGGMVIGSAAGSDRLCRRLAEMSGFIVFTVDYPLAPEHKFPEPYEASVAAVQWATKHAAAWGGDASRIILMGESAGGTLAAAIGANAPKHVVEQIRGTILLYPALQPVTPASLTESQFKYREYLLSLDNMILFWHLYLRTPADEFDSRAAPVRATDEQLAQSPPTVLVVATQDILRDEGVNYLQRLESVGVSTKLMEYPNTVHCFFARRVFTHGRQALQDVVATLQSLVV